MAKTKKNINIFQIILTISFLILSFSVFYYLIIYIPGVRKETQKEKLIKENRIELEKKTEEERINNCKEEYRNKISGILNECSEQHKNGIYPPGCTDDWLSKFFDDWEKDKIKCIKNLE